MIDYEELTIIANINQPKLIVTGATAYPRVFDFKRLRSIADSVGALLMADIAHISGLIAGGEHPSPIGHAQVVTSPTQKTLRGPRGGMILCDSEIAKKIDRAVFPNSQGGPLGNTIAAKAVAFGEALQPEFVLYQQQIKSIAKALAKGLADGGIRLVSGGTDNHMVLADVTPLGINGKQAEEALVKANIVVNRNTIPYDINPPRIGSGIRLGTPAVSSRGMGETEMLVISSKILEVLHNIENEAVLTSVRTEIVELANHFPVPGIDV